MRHIGVSCIVQVYGVRHARASRKDEYKRQVRIPVPHFIFGDDPVYCEPYVPCIEYLDKAFDWAEETGLSILIDLHTAPESQLSLIHIFHLQIDADEGVEELACINIILQPFVENAIMYSIAKAPDRETCRIHIRAACEGQDLVFRITDNGFGMSREQIERIFEENSYDVSHGYGAKNVNFRIKLCYGEEYGVFYESEIGKGTTVTVRIPAMTPEEAERKLDVYKRQCEGCEVCLSGSGFPAVRN